MVDEREPLPESVSALFDIALRAYVRRWPLYAGVAALGFALQALLALARPNDSGMLVGGAVVVDAFVATLVTLGVVGDVKLGDRVPGPRVLAAAVPRWWIVAGATALTTFVTNFTTAAMFGPPEDTLYGFLIPIIVVGAGTLNFASVIAAIDTKTRPELLIFSSVGRSFALATARANIGRLIFLAFVGILPTLLEAVLEDQLHLRKVAGFTFLGTIPLDSATTGVLQAVFTVFYLDFVRRSGK